MAGQQASLRATWIAALAAAIVLWQFAARHLTGHPYGTFSNPHYLAYFSLLLLPLLALMIWWLRAPHRFLLIPIFLLNIELVFNNFEKPTIPLLGISAAIAAVIWSNTSTRARWSTAAFFVVLGVAVWFWIPATWLSDVGLAAPEGDERVEIWADTWRMISAGHMQSWLVGHGLGTFQEHFPNYAVEQFRSFTLPHNHVLELLYESGLCGSLPVMALLGYLAVRSTRFAGGFRDDRLRRISQCNLAALAIWFVFSFLAFGFFSRYTLYPFGFLVGIHLYLADRWEDESRAPPPPNRDSRGIRVRH